MRCIAAFIIGSVAFLAKADSSAIQQESARRVEAARDKQLRSAGRQVSIRPGEFFVSPWMNSPTPMQAATVGAGSSTQAFVGCDPVPEAELQTLIDTAAKRENVSPKLLKAMIRQESGGRACAVSDKGAQGLMQLMPATQRDLNVSAPFDPAESIRGGAAYIAELLRKYKGDTRRALAAYNAGPQRVDPEGPLPDIPETRSYVDVILADLEP